MWSNFHTHCNYCDGKGELSDVVHSAEQFGMLSLGFSSHAPLPFTSPWCMKPERLNNYLSEIEELKKSSRIQIYAGLEVDFIPETISPSNFRDKLDYTIGSVHFVDQLPNGTHWEIDGTHTHFLTGFEQIFQNNIKDVISRSMELTQEMVTQSQPNIVGHLDKIKIQNIDNKLFNETDSWYQELIRKTVDVIAEAGCIIEVNTRGIYQKKSSTTYPSPWILEYIHQKKVPVTLSSDAHHPDDLINQFNESALLLNTIGFKTISILHEGEWKALPFSEHGIILR